MTGFLRAIQILHVVLIVGIVLALALILVESPRAQAQRASGLAMLRFQQDPDSAAQARQALLIAVRRDPWQALHWRRLAQIDRAAGGPAVMEAQRAEAIAKGFYEGAPP